LIGRTQTRRSRGDGSDGEKGLLIAFEPVICF
jgi:hypothetical protein